MKLGEVLIDIREPRITTRNLPEMPKTVIERLFSLTVSKIYFNARFLDAESGVKGSERSKSSRLGRIFCLLRFGDSCAVYPFRQSRNLK